MNEFFENVTEWEPSCSLYFGDNVLQDVLAPRKFTTTIDTVAVSEELSAEGMAVSENNLVSIPAQFYSITTSYFLAFLQGSYNSLAWAVCLTRYR